VILAGTGGPNGGISPNFIAFPLITSPSRWYLSNISPQKSCVIGGNSGTGRQKFHPAILMGQGRHLA
jgi:hypothetical protein